MDAAGFYRQGKRYFVEREGQENALLILTTAGSGCIRCVQADGTECGFPSGPGSAVLLDCRRFHRYATDPEGGGPWEFLWVHFRGDFVQPFVDRCSGRALPLSGATRERVERAMSELRDLAGTISTQADLRIAGLVHELLVLWVEAEARIEGAGPREGSGLAAGTLAAVSDAVEILRREYAEPLTVGDLAVRVHLSPSHLARLFRKAYGVGPYRYLSILRINQAKRMLTVEKRGVEETARLCGFCSSSNFIREFRRIDGDTPRGFVLQQSR